MSEEAIVEGTVTYDAEADVLYVALGDIEATVGRSTSLDDLRIIDYSDEGTVLGIEFISASSGVDLSDVPFQHRVERLIGDSGLPIRLLA